ncbi:MAG: glycosyltransferase [Acidimicrobiia bacterium]
MAVDKGDLWFIGPSDMLKGRVEPTIWARMASSFSEEGWKVRLITPFAYRPGRVHRDEQGRLVGEEPKGIPIKEVRRYFSLSNAVRLVVLPTPRAPGSSLGWYRLTVGTVFSIYAGWVLLGRALSKHGRSRQLVIYGRGYISYLPFLLVGQLLRRWLTLSYVFETNAVLFRERDRDMLRRADLVVVHSELLKSDLVGLGIPSERIHVAYLASTIWFDKDAERSDSTESNMDVETLPKPCAVYTGKGTAGAYNILEEVARLLNDVAVHVIVVGSNPRATTLNNLHFLGFVPPSLVGSYQAAADVLLNIVDPDRTIARHVTPTKLFDYMQIGRPIVSMPFPALGEFVDGGGVIVARNSAEIADGIRRLLDDQVLALDLGRQALALSKRFTWPNRAAGISEALGSVMP